MVKVLSQQSLLDVAIQQAGTAEAAVLLALANGLSVTDELDAGQELTTVAAIDRDIFNYYANNQLKPATAVVAAAAGGLDEGVEFWYVEYDFVVS
jgi:hypothetical protein